MLHMHGRFSLLFLGLVVAKCESLAYQQKYKDTLIEVSPWGLNSLRITTSKEGPLDFSLPGALGDVPDSQPSNVTKRGERACLVTEEVRSD